MNTPVKKIVILGGGSAGWITAGVIAAAHEANNDSGIEVLLIESPDVKPVGVGEGTWPSMRTTLSKMGVSETDLFRECDASFKQGAKFAKWVTGKEDDFYYHPLVLPQGFTETDLVPQWQKIREKVSYADAFSFQGQLCEKNLAPKQITTPEYAAVANYAYHLDSAKLGSFLQRHCTQKLGVRHILDLVTKVNSTKNGNIRSLTTTKNGEVSGDLFIDCTGFSSLLIGKHFKIPFKEKRSILFNDTALAAHVPYEHEDSSIASHTISTAQTSGWIWDIGLPTRRGTGHVFSSAHISDEQAAKELQKHLSESIGQKKAENLSLRKIKINPGYREKFWHNNCVAVGLSAGFIEPLEASALVLIELSAEMISDELPATQDHMEIVAKRFNRRFLYRWERIIEFLKLHYILTKRTDSEYWIDNCQKETIPDRLLELIELWRYSAPSQYDFPETKEIFSSANWHYILYGMGFETYERPTGKKSDNPAEFEKHLITNKNMLERCLKALPTNRDLISKILQYGIQKI